MYCFGIFVCKNEGTGGFKSISRFIGGEGQSSLLSFLSRKRGGVGQSFCQAFFQESVAFYSLIIPLSRS